MSAPKTNIVYALVGRVETTYGTILSFTSANRITR